MSRGNAAASCLQHNDGVVAGVVQGASFQNKSSCRAEEPAQSLVDETSYADADALVPPRGTW